MIKSVQSILLLFFIGALFQAVALQSEETSSSSIKSEKLKENPKNVEKSIEFEAKENKSAQIKDKKKSRSVFGKKTDRKNKRKVAGMAYQCSETWTDEFSFGYIQVGSKCDSNESLCLAHFYIARNYCEEGALIRYYCDPKQPSLFSTEKIKCEKSCEFSGLSGACIR